MAKISLSTGKSFESDDGASLLTAAANAGLNMPYSCRIGRCSTCKCKVISGKSIALHPESGLSEDEKADGFILSCVRSAVSDMMLEADDLGTVELPKVLTTPARIQALDMLSKDVIGVVLRLPPNCNFDFLPGQYVDIIRQGVRRSYSLANTCVVDKQVELQIRAVPGGAMSNYWFGEAKINDLLHLNGPLGTFFLRNIAGLDLVFLATGTGIAPVKSMIGAMGKVPEGERPRSISVFWGGRHGEDLYLDFAPGSATYRFTPVLSRPIDNWLGANGYVQSAFLATGPELMQTVVYAAGSDAMIRSAKEVLMQAGLPERRFLSDAFVRSGAF